MNVNDDLVLSVTIGKRTGEPTKLSVTVRDLPANAIERVLVYGFQRFINDPIGAGDLTVEDRVKAARVSIDNLKTGITGRARTETVDPFQVILLRVIRRRLKAKKPDWVKTIDAMDKKDAEAELMRIFNAQPAAKQDEIKNEASVIRKQQEQLAKLREAASIETDDL